jgi:bifunctional DNA-binding transcriptional regulator/antitoxin component of YhaV-PrlF toxin-antitoxin module
VSLSAAEVELKIGKEGITYVPKRLREQYGLKPHILPNETTAIMYRPDADPVAMVKSLEVLIDHIKLRIKDPAEKTIQKEDH